MILWSGMSDVFQYNSTDGIPDLIHVYIVLAQGIL
jgi:hypothetical protein